MFNPPQPPFSFATLQVECAACRELFTLAEGGQNARRGRFNWRHAGTTQPYVNLRFLPERDRQAAAPQHRPHTIITDSPDTPSGEHDSVSINCPRCGADNRNWVQVLHTPWPMRLRAFWPAGLGLLSTMAIWLVAVFRYHDQFSPERRLVFFLVLLVSGFSTSLLLPLTWRAQRDYANARAQNVPRPWAAPTWQAALGLLLVFVFLLPGFMYVAMPLGFDFVADLLSPPPTTLPERIQQVREQFNQQAAILPAEEQGSVESSIYMLEKILDLNPGPVGTRERGLRALQEAERWAAAEPDNPNTHRIAQEVIRLETAVAVQQPPRVDREFLKTWFKYMLAVTALAALSGGGAAVQVASRLDRHLPRPIYFSLADMTRVVAWEAKRALELPGDMSQLEWLKAERNVLGGLTLVGIARALPELSPDGTVPGHLVNARRYEVFADHWGRIVQTEVRHIQAPASRWPAPEKGQSEADEIYRTLEKLFQPQATRIAL